MTAITHQLSSWSSMTIGDIETADPRDTKAIVSENEDVHASILCLQDSFETHPSLESSCTLSLSSNDNLRHHMLKTDSVLSNLVQAEIDEENKESYRLSLNTRFYIFFLILPTIVLLYYSIAILFPPDIRKSVPYLLWTDGFLMENDNGRMTVCPKESICAEGETQIILIFMSRTSAFASYSVLGLTFLSKMHCSINWLSFTHASTCIPFESLHKIHKKMGRIYFMLILMHAVGHFVRWFIRHETIKRVNTTIGISGLVGLLAMIFAVISMTKMAKVMTTFETRVYGHYLSLLMVVALCFHTARCRNITLIFFGLWSLDYLYGYFFKTYRLDIVEFSPLPGKAGVQMLWHNPKGFQPKAGQYVKIKFPWLGEGGNEWHAFSIYMHEATEQGLRSVLRKRTERRKSIQGQACNMDEGNDNGRKVDASKTAVILINIQNEFVSSNGNLHECVQSELSRTGMVEKTVMLAEVARKMGAHVFHVPLIINDKGNDHPNKNFGFLKDCREQGLFMENTWNAKIINGHKPRDSDIVVKGQNGLDSFSGTNLEEQLREKGIETVIIGGLLTNCTVESTMRTAYEKGYNVITLIDGTACKSLQEHIAATQGTFRMFSTPLSCHQASIALMGNAGLNLPTPLSNPSRPTSSLEDFTAFVLTRQKKDYNPLESALIMEEARKDMHSHYKTTQIFIAPVGNWTKRVAREITDKNQLRSCWVRGPYTSPFSVASSYNHMVFVATGIGITPALGVMGQYSGSSRSKFLVWSTRCPYMLKFFAPLLKDAHVAAVFYTGKKYVFTEEELISLRSYGNIYFEHGRPKSTTAVIESLMVTYENQCRKLVQGWNPNSSRIQSDITIDNMDKKSLQAWCVLYCGGSKKIKSGLRKYTKEKGIPFECELFDL